MENASIIWLSENTLQLRATSLLTNVKAGQ